jgi:nicotinate phosphoribosyltransferase
MWGIGTKLITAYDQPALGAVYKMVSIENATGEMEDTIKISANAEKVTTPGLKKVYRIINRKNGKSEGDYIAMSDENPTQEKRLKMFHPVHTFVSKFVTDFDAKDLHTKVIDNGEVIYENPSLVEMRQYAFENLELLWDEYKRSLNPEEYPVDLSQKCWDNKMRNIQEVRDMVVELEK